MQGHAIHCSLCSFEQFIAHDVEAIEKPDTETPFVNKQDAISRLLPYHLLHEPDVKEDFLHRVDARLETVFQDLQEARQTLYDQFGAILMRNAMRTSEVVDDCLTLYLFNSNEQQMLSDDRQLAENDFGELQIKD